MVTKVRGKGKNMKLNPNMALETEQSFQYHRGLWILKLNCFFKSSRSPGRRGDAPQSNSSPLPWTVMKKLFVVCTLGASSRVVQKTGRDDSTSYDAIKTPATVEQRPGPGSRNVPLMDTAKPTDERHVANLSYLATGAVKKAFEFNGKAFVEQGWKELPNSSVTEQSASASFSRNGFIVFVSSLPVATATCRSGCKSGQR